MGKIHRNHITQKYNNQEIFAFNQKWDPKRVGLFCLGSTKEKEEKTEKRKRNILQWYSNYQTSNKGQQLLKWQKINEMNTAMALM